MQADLTPPVYYVTVEMDPASYLTPPVYYVMVEMDPCKPISRRQCAM